MSGAETGLAGKVCIVSGGGSGIGRATALRVAEEGAGVVLVGRTATKLERVRREVEAAGGIAAVHSLDVADPEATRVMAQQVLARFGRVDVLINNAGEGSSHRRLSTTTPEEIRSVLDSNLLGTIYCTQAVVPAMLQAGRGTIINLASIVGLIPSVHAGMIYGAAKAAVINFSRFLEIELRNSNIRTCVVLPGEVDTPLLDRRPHPPDAAARATMITAEDVAAVIAFVAMMSQRASIRQIVIRPTFQRDVGAELEKA